MLEPKIKRSLCSYCGNAPVNHFLSYLENLLTVTLDASTTRVVRNAPKFIKDLADLIPVWFFKGLVAVNLARYSEDIDKAASFRSRIIWEEARKRGIKMDQIILGKKALDYYRAHINGKDVYFESIPMPSGSLDMKKDWDNKAILKKEFEKHGIPVPKYVRISAFKVNNLEVIFAKLAKPIIVKPEIGSRARHTITHISNFNDFKKGVRIAMKICPYVIAEEHLDGHVCRATLVGGQLAGFYRGSHPYVIGDGEKTIKELIVVKDSFRPDRVEKVNIGDELDNHIARLGYTIDDVLEKDKVITLTHHVGRLFGGKTKEMIDELHPSFVPILEKAARVVELTVAGFDCIIPDPTKDAGSQKWGIIECNTLPFIDLHYYALEGKPRNIAGMIWDLWGLSSPGRTWTA